MEIFIKILQGPYAYLLIFQILVVSGLLLGLLWLLVQRTREAHEEVAGQTSVVANAVAAPPPAELAVLQARIVELEAENTLLKNAQTDTQDLKDKVKYLESKLLEYEILQEEIGTLTALKLENEHLKQELSHLQIKKDAAAAAAAVPAVASVAATNPVATPSAPTFPPAPETSHPMVIMTAPEPAPPAPGGELPSAEENTAGLEGLLKQIDELTTSTPTNPKT